MASNRGFLIVDLSSICLALKPVRGQGITRLVFKMPLGQNAIVTVFNCSFIFSCETWSRWVQTTTPTLPMSLLAISSGRCFQSLLGISSNDTNSMITFNSDATWWMSDSRSPQALESGAFQAQLSLVNLPPEGGSSAVSSWLLDEDVSF